MASEVFRGRRSFVDAERVIFGYELLYRGRPDRATAFDDHTDEIIRGVVRAGMVAALLSNTDSVRCGVTAALLSVADHLYDAPIGELLDELPVGDATIGAVLHGTGPIGEALDMARACERDDRVALEQLAPGRYAEFRALRQRLEDTARRTFQPTEAAAVPEPAKRVTPQLT